MGGEERKGEESAECPVLNPTGTFPLNPADAWSELK